MPRYDQAQDAALLKVLEKRRSVRAFSPEAVSKEDVEKIVYAGLLAPYAAAAVEGVKDFRRFVVIAGNNPKLSLVSELCKTRAAQSLAELKSRFAGRALPPFASRLERAQKSGLPGLGRAPWYIIACEQRGIPPAERQSLAHVMQNMWLRAASLDLGFQLISSFDQLADEKQFTDAIGIPHGRYAVAGCAIGVPEKPPEPNPFAQTTNLDDFLSWAD
jgi:nitroreductase